MSRHEARSLICRCPVWFDEGFSLRDNVVRDQLTVFLCFRDPSLIACRVPFVMVSVAQRIRYLTPPGGFKYWLPSQSSSLIFSFDASSSFIMYVKVLTTFQHRLVAQAVHDYWTISHATVCSRSVQVISQFQAGHTDDFRAYVDKLVRPIIFCPFSSFNFLVLVRSARYLRVHQRVWLAPCDYRRRFIFNPGMCSVSYQPSWIIRFLDRRYRLRSWHDGCPSARLVSIRTVVSQTAIFGDGSEDDPIIISDDEEIVADQNISAWILAMGFINYLVLWLRVSFCKTCQPSVYKIDS